MIFTDLKVIFDDGDSLTTRINLCQEDAKKYYLGNKFNIGFGPLDNVKLCVKVEIL